jgi:hypothetical protein
MFGGARRLRHLDGIASSEMCRYIRNVSEEIVVSIVRVNNCLVGYDYV